MAVKEVKEMTSMFPILTVPSFTLPCACIVVIPFLYNKTISLVFHEFFLTYLTF